MRERRQTNPETPSSRTLVLWATVKAWMAEDRENRSVVFSDDPDRGAVVTVRIGTKLMDDQVKTREDPWTTVLRVISALGAL